MTERKSPLHEDHRGGPVGYVGAVKYLARITVVLALGLTGCAAQSFGPHRSTMTGIPLLLGTSQSAVATGPQTGFTTRHGTVPFETIQVSNLRDARKIRTGGGIWTEVGAEVVPGQEVTLMGTGLFGNIRVTKVRVTQVDLEFCEDIPDLPSKARTCAPDRRSRVFAMQVPNANDFHGWSGGGVYDDEGGVVGMIAYGLTSRESDGYETVPLGDFVLAYPIADLKQEMGL